MDSTSYFSSAAALFSGCASRLPFRSKTRLALRGFTVLGFLWFALAMPALAQSWNLSWSDEFNGAANSAIDSANWTYDTGVLNVNNEIEYYCAPGSNTAPCVSGTPNAYIDGSGHLIIQAIKINSSVAPNSGSWTSARLKSQNLQSFQYGRLESSMKLPIGAGIWPAYWALGSNIDSVGWPNSGEIDFMENVPASAGQGPTVISSTIHGGNSSSDCYCGGNGLGHQFDFPANQDVTSFHTYGGIWSTNMVQFYVDDPKNIFFVRTASDLPSNFTWDFNHPFFLLLNLAIGGTGSWPGPPDSNTPNPALMSVDYVRRYTPGAVAGPTMSAPAINVTAGQIGQTTLNLNSTSGTGRVYLTCSTNAPKASCSLSTGDALDEFTVDFSSASSGTTAIRVATTANTSARLDSPRHGLQNLRLQSVEFLAAAFGLFGFVLYPTKWNLRVRRSLGGAGLMLILLVHPGCGGSGGQTGGGGGGRDNGTSPGNYTVTVNAYTLSNTTGNADSTATIALTVN